MTADGTVNAKGQQPFNAVSCVSITSHASMPLTGKLPESDRVLDHTLKARVSQSPRASRKYFEVNRMVMARFNDIVSGWTTGVRKLLPLASGQRW